MVIVRALHTYELYFEDNVTSFNYESSIPMDYCCLQIRIVNDY